VTITTGECATFHVDVGGNTFNSGTLKDSYSKIDSKTVTVQGNDVTGRVLVVEAITETHGLECWTA